MFTCINSFTLAMESEPFSEQEKEIQEILDMMKQSSQSLDTQLFPTIEKEQEKQKVVETEKDKRKRQLEDEIPGNIKRANRRNENKARLKSKLDDLSNKYNEALNLFLAKDYEKAITLFKAIESESGNTDFENFKKGYSQLFIARIYEQQNKYDEALKYFQLARCTRDLSSKKEAEYHLGMFFVNLKKYDEALFYLKSAASKHLELLLWFQVDANYQIGLIYYEQNNYEQALKFLKSIPYHSKEISELINKIDFLSQLIE